MSKLGQYRWREVGHSTSQICSTVASLNQGNSENGRNNSRSSSRIQNPCPEMLVTSSSKVGVPRASDFIGVFLYKSVGDPKLFTRQTIVLGQVDLWFHPELGFSASGMNMDVHAWFLA